MSVCDKENKMEYWYFTFGCGQKYGNRRNKYVKVPGDYETARKRMIDYYGTKWCMQYSEARMKEIIDKYGTEEYNEGINFEEED